ncbi:ATP-binding protein [Streptomyces sp. NPDC048002]|uniref:ATP-binding protein n=1 Tax=Streptomyces sp. NPDC048002 TaxID=3154344 RepID=UPI003402B969
MTAARTHVTGRAGCMTADLPCVPESVARARALVSSVLAGWGLGHDLADIAELVVSELMTNAVDHTETDRTEVVIERQADSTVRIQVSDTSSVAPHMEKAADDAECGRGLRLVDALCVRWGYDPHARGKVAWAEIKAPAGGEQ